MSRHQFSRRCVLRAVGGLGAGAVTTGLGTSAAVAASDRAVVGTATDATTERVRRVARATHRTLTFDGGRGAVVGTFSASALVDLAGLPDVRYVEPDRPVTKRDHDAGDYRPWGVSRIGAPAARHAGSSAAGVHVAVVDSGIDSDHPDLTDALGEGRAFVDCGACASDGNDNPCREPWDDDEGHGTHVAGIVGAASDGGGVVGTAPGATLHAVKALNCSGAGRASDVAAAIRYVADRGWDVATMSLGGDHGSSLLRDAVRYAADRGVFLVAAAGNDSCADCVGYPAAYPEVVAVSATTEGDDVASFSSTGPEVDLAAPGQRILSTVADAYAYASGTSAAAPHVAGAAAHLAAAGLSGSAIRERLRETATDLGLPSDEQGAGLVDVDAAVDGGAGGDTGGGDAADPAPVGETGIVSTGQSDPTAARTVPLDGRYDAPVALPGPLSYEGWNPSHARLRDVRSDALDFAVEEWAYLNGVHKTERIPYAVFEAGAFEGADGTAFEAGTTTVDHRFARLSFDRTFAETPVLLSACQSYNGRDPVVARQRNVSTTGAEVRFQEEEATGGWHTTETVGYLAVEPGVGTLGGRAFEAGRTADAVTHDWHRVAFGQRVEDPVFLAAQQTYDGSNTAGLRHRNLTATGVDVFVEEERSADGETAHVAETVGYLVFEGSGRV